MMAAASPVTVQQRLHNTIQPPLEQIVKPQTMDKIGDYQNNLWFITSSNNVNGSLSKKM